MGTCGDGVCVRPPFLTARNGMLSSSLRHHLHRGQAAADTHLLVRRHPGRGRALAWAACRIYLFHRSGIEQPGMLVQRSGSMHGAPFQLLLAPVPCGHVRLSLVLSHLQRHRLGPNYLLLPVNAPKWVAAVLALHSLCPAARVRCACMHDLPTPSSAHSCEAVALRGLRLTQLRAHVYVPVQVCAPQQPPRGLHELHDPRRGDQLLPLAVSTPALVKNM